MPMRTKTMPIRNKDKQLKFAHENEPNKNFDIVVKLSSYDFETDDYGSRHVYWIEENADHNCDHFIASQKLHEKISALKGAAGDLIKISKVNDDPKYQFGYFNADKVQSVESHAMGSGFAQKDRSTDNFEKQFKQSDNKLDLHELTLRVETLEKQMQEFKQKQTNDIPF